MLSLLMCVQAPGMETKVCHTQFAPGMERISFLSGLLFPPPSSTVRFPNSEEPVGRGLEYHCFIAGRSTLNRTPETPTSRLRSLSASPAPCGKGCNKRTVQIASGESLHRRLKLCLVSLESCEEPQDLSLQGLSDFGDISLRVLARRSVYLCSLEQDLVQRHLRDVGSTVLPPEGCASVNSPSLTVSQKLLHRFKATAKLLAGLLLRPPRR